jgi:hypothetical protein
MPPPQDASIAEIPTNELALRVQVVKHQAAAVTLEQITRNGPARLAVESMVRGISRALEMRRRRARDVVKIQPLNQCVHVLLPKLWIGFQL